jgi:xanthine dehydrogenase accessory factor
VTGTPLGPAEAAELAGAARAGGPPVAIVLCVSPAPCAGERIAVAADGAGAGSFSDPELDTIARAVARRALEHETAPFTETVAVSAEPATLYVEVVRAPELLVVVGAGHIAVPLVRHGVELGFRVTVLDDREAFATTERFPAAAHVARADFADDPFAGVPIDSTTYIVLVTRGHRWDFDCLRRLIDAPSPPRYIGMIGSRRRVRAAFSALLEAGYARETLAQVRAPIGIEIGAETPEEIAISIAAELIAVRRGRAIETIGGRERVLERLLPEVRE